MANKLSVVIITYNMGAQIGTALESLSLQTRKDFEVIIVDNHSTDETLQVIKKYSELHAKVLEIHNEGILSKSRNLGVSHSKGEWIAFLDADDYWEKEKVEDIYSIIDSVDEDCVVISHKCYEEHIGGRKKKIIKIPFDKDNLTKFLITCKNPFCLSGTIIRKETLLSIGGFSEDLSYRTVEDYELWIRLSMIGRFYYLEKPLATIVLHEGNYSKKADIQMKALHIMKTKYLNSYQAISEAERKKAYVRLYELEVRCLQKNGFFGEAINKGYEAFKLHYYSLKLMIVILLCYVKVKK